MPDDSKPPNFNRTPMLWLAGAFAAGILAANFAPIDLRALLAAIAGFAILAIFLRAQTISTYLVLIAFAAAGAASIHIETQKIAPNRIRVLYDKGVVDSGDPVEVEGVLTTGSEPSVDGVFLNLRVRRLIHRGLDHEVSGNVRLFLPQDDVENPEANLRYQISDLKYGSRLRIACKLSRDDAFLNPGVIPRKDLLDRLGIDATGSIKSYLMIERIADESVFLPLAWVFDQRAKLIDDFRKNLNAPAAGVMIASLLGDKHFLDKGTADVFREGGTFHILVISGLHITFIGGLLLLFVRQFTRNRWTQFIATALVLWAYTLAVGADIPVVRAAIMFTVISFSHVIYRQRSLLNSFGLCALILLVWRPADLFNPSFQLTFLSVAAIIAMAYPLIENLRNIGEWTPMAKMPFPPNVPPWLRRFCETLYWRDEAWQIESKRNIWTANLFKSPYQPKAIGGGVQKAAQYVVEGLLISLVVQIWMLPLLVVYFHRVSLSSIPLNLWVGFFIALESFAAVTGAVANYFSGMLAAPFYTLAEIFNWLMLLLPNILAHNNWLSFRLPGYSGKGFAVYALYFLPVIFLAMAISRWTPFEFKQRQRHIARHFLYPALGTLVVLIGVIVFHPFSEPHPDGRLHIDFLDVGQGDAALVTFPDGTTMLVDGGGRFNYGRGEGEDAEPFEPDIRGIGESVVSEFLWDRGYARLDHFLATHADADHIQGLTEVAENFTVGSAFFGRMPMDDPDFASLADVLRRRGIPLTAVERGDRLRFGDVTVEVLYPSQTGQLPGRSENDNSVVLRVIYGQRSFLLTGDIERQAETDLVSGGGTLTADLIKVAHHGSRTSSTQEFVDRVGARYAVISVGRSSSFGHPHSEVVVRWQAAGASVMTTGTSGMISVSTDGSDLRVSEFCKMKPEAKRQQAVLTPLLISLLASDCLSSDCLSSDY